MGASKDQFLELRQQDVAGVSFEHLLDAKKSNLQSAVSKIEQVVRDGQFDELKALILAKKGAELFSQLEKAIRPLAEDAYVNKVGKDYSAHDCKVEVADTGVKYDYSACNDPIWQELNSIAANAIEALKQRENMLKTITKNTTLVNEDTGEVYTINPPVRSGKTGLKLTIK